jgi:hypothetical protein
VPSSPQQAISSASQVWDEDQEAQQLQAAIEGDALSAESLRRLMFLL